MISCGVAPASASAVEVALRMPCAEQCGRSACQPVLKLVPKPVRCERLAELRKQERHIGADFRRCNALDQRRVLGDIDIDRATPASRPSSRVIPKIPAAQPGAQLSCSAANVGPKSAYRSCTRTIAGERRPSAEPKWPVHPLPLYPRPMVARPIQNREIGRAIHPVVAMMTVRIAPVAVRDLG